MSRRKSFDRDQIIEKSMRLFWKNGYHGTSLNELTKATGLQKGSLYGAFQSKENLFRISLELYGSKMRSFFIDDECPAKYLKAFFQSLIKEGSSGEGKDGCLIMNSVQEFGKERDQKSKLANSLFFEIYQNFDKTLELALEQNLIPQDFDKKIQVDRLVGAAFSIRELSKFQKDKDLFLNIANGALKDLGIFLTSSEC